jgi:hypothetical protein
MHINPSTKRATAARNEVIPSMAKKNPWLAAASIGATGNTYKIRTVTDFFLVPEDRRRICLREFHAWMAIQEGITALILAMSDTLDVGVKPEHLHWRNEVFRWVDDGKASIGVEIQEMEPPQVVSERP